MKLRDWIGPVLAILIPLSAGGIHLERAVATLAAQQKATADRVERIERMIDNQRMTASLDE